MSILKVNSRYALIASALLFLVASHSQAEVFTSLRFTRIGSQTFAVPTTYVLLPRFRPVQQSGPEVWQVRLQSRSGTFTRSYRVGNSALAMQRARRENPSASILAVRKK